MKTRGAFPVGTFADDLTIERELLEAPSSEPTLLGGHEIQAPPYHCVAAEVSRLTLVEALDAWDAQTWGNA